VVELNIHP